MRADTDDDPPPGVLRWLVSCDESGMHGSPCYGFGTLFMRWQRRGDLAQLMRDICRRHRYRDEIKWKNVRASSLGLYRELSEEFFRAPWMGFHCLVVRRSDVNLQLHGGSLDTARQKHFGMLLNTKLTGCLKSHRHRQQTVRVYADPIHSPYAKAVEVVEKITRSTIRRAEQNVTVEGVFEKDSKQTPTIQLCDLLLGAVMSAWAREPASGAKAELSRHIAGHLGWDDLRADTEPSERKFNVWMFHDPTRSARAVRTRPVRLKYPLPSRQNR